MEKVKLKFSKRKKLLLGVVGLCVILAVSSIVSWQSRQVVEAAVLDPHPGLVGWWRFDEGSGTIAGDSSGNGNNGTINGATWVTGRYETALNFNGSGNVLVHDGANLHIVNALTVEAWINGNIFDAGWNFILTKTSAYELAVFNGQLAIRLGLVNHGDTYYFGGTVVTGQWYHLAMTYDGLSFNGYINGVLIINKPVSDTIVTNTNHLEIGSETGAAFFNGVIDEVHVYNRDLSAAEIQADFQQNPDFSSKVLAKVLQGTTQVITTLSWQGTGSINVTIVSPSQSYTESILPEYQKSVYSTSGGTSSMLNIKRLSVSVSALSSDQNWYVVLAFDNVSAYQITVEVQK